MAGYGLGIRRLGVPRATIATDAIVPAFACVALDARTASRHIRGCLHAPYAPRRLFRFIAIVLTSPAAVPHSRGPPALSSMLVGARPRVGYAQLPSRRCSTQGTSGGNLEKLTNLRAGAQDPPANGIEIYRGEALRLPMMVEEVQPCQISCHLGSCS